MSCFRVICGQGCLKVDIQAYYGEIMIRSAAFKTTAILLTLASLGAMVEIDAKTYYVNANAHYNGNGKSWKHAFNNLQSALEAVENSSCHNDIWVAQGTYKPTVVPPSYVLGSFVPTPETLPNLVTFLLPSNVSIYGGFSGHDPDNCFSERDPCAYPTIISGDILGNDVNIPGNFTNKSDNAWHVFTAVGAKNVQLNGLKIIDGYAGGPDSGTVDSSTGTSVVTFIDYAFDMGAGLFARSGSKIELCDVEFHNNIADSALAVVYSAPPPHPLIAGGGGIGAIDAGTVVTIKGCKFENNAAINSTGIGAKDGASGGALEALLDGAFVISKSYFSDNLAGRVGGAIHLRASAQSSVKDSTFKRNSTIDSFIGDSSGGAIAVFNASLTVDRSIFKENTAISGNGAGGAIFFNNPFDDGETYIFTVTDSEFTGNLASAIGGGAIIIAGVLPNPLIAPVIKGCKFKENIASIGGAIDVDSINVLIEDCTFIRNQAKSGGAIFGANYAKGIFGIGAPNPLASVVTVKDSDFKYNSIANVPFGNQTTVFILDITAFLSAQAIGLPTAHVFEVLPGGGAVAFMMGGIGHFKNCKFKGNEATALVTGIRLGPPTFPDTGAALAKGGAVLAGGSLGEGGGTNFPMNQGFVDLCNPTFIDNLGSGGTNDTAIIDLAGLGQTPIGVDIVINPICACP